MATESGEELDLEERRRMRSESRKTQTYRLFIKDLMSNGQMADELAECAATSVLCALDQRLLADEAQDLEAQLPAKLKHLLSRCEKHENAKPRKFSRAEFINLVAEDLGRAPEETEGVVRAVFTTIRDHVSAGEVDQVIHQLPLEYRDLWQRAS